MKDGHLCACFYVCVTLLVLIVMGACVHVFMCVTLLVFKELTSVLEPKPIQRTTF
jgi:hypothetical protein